MEEFNLETKTHDEIVDITAEVAAIVERSFVFEGICMVFVPHTTAGVCINENADPDVKHDMMIAIKSIVKDDFRFKHDEGNSAAHVKATLVGSSVTMPVIDGKIALGQWQGIYFMEFDGPRTRKVQVIVK